MWLPGTFLNQSSDTKIKVKIGQNLKIKSTVKGLMSCLAAYYSRACSIIFNELPSCVLFKGVLLFLMSSLAAYYSRVCSIIFNELPSYILFKGVLYYF